MRRAFFIISAIVCVALPARADGELTVTWNTSSDYSAGDLGCDANGGRASDGSGANACQPINIDFCASGNTARTFAVDVSWTDSTPLLPSNPKLYVWMTSSSSCGDPDQDGIEMGRDIDANLAGATFTYPTDVDDALSLTTTLFIDSVDACGSAAEGDYLLCAQISGDDITGTVDASGGAAFRIDTLEPAAPTISETRSMDEQVSLTVDATDDDVTWWQIIYLAQPTAETAPESFDEADCTTWSGMSYVASSQNAANDPSNTITLKNLDNNTLYLACAVVRDAAGNVSAASAVVPIQPQAECDFAECFPDTLQTGYCGTTSGNLWAGALLGWGLILLGARTSRRRRT